MEPVDVNERKFVGGGYVTEVKGKKLSTVVHKYRPKKNSVIRESPQLVSPQLVDDRE